MTLDHRRNIRLAELRALFPLLPPSGKLLEIGAGAGWQAKMLAEAGFDVTAIDVKLDRYASLREARVWPVQEYAGSTLPFADSSFDIVFSSNTLPHIPELDIALREIHRVLKPGGLVAHILPTSSWRVWTSLTQFVNPHIVNPRIVFRAIKRLRQTDPSNHMNSCAGASHPRSNLWSLAGKILPSRLGERGTAWSEIAQFTESAWGKVFTAANFEMRHVVPCRVFNTGRHLLGPWLPVGFRTLMARILGSSGKCYVMTPAPETRPKEI